MYDGKCTSCSGGRFSGTIGQESMQSDVQKVRGGKRPFPVWAVVLSVIVVFFIFMLVLIGSVARQVVNNVMDFSGVVEVTPEWMVPAPVVPEPDYDYENGAAFYCYYPFIIGCDKAYVEEINAKIAGLATSFVPTTLSKDDYGYVDGYVTYMSEEKMSVVLEYYYEHDGNEEFHIAALNFDMKTGKEISIQEMLPAFEFMVDFREGCEIQNGDYMKEVLDKMTDADIQGAILNPETGVAFYSPVGLDIGFNYPDGWMTVTFKFATY